MLFRNALRPLVQELATANKQLLRSAVRFYNEDRFQKRDNNSDSRNRDFKSYKPRNFKPRDNFRDGNDRYSSRGDGDRYNSRSGSYNTRDGFNSRGNYNNKFKRPNQFNKFENDSRTRSYKNDKFSSKRNNSKASEEVDLAANSTAEIIHIKKNSEDLNVSLKDLFEKDIISRDLHSSIDKMKFPSLSPVQQKTIEPIITNSDSDVIARAKTGTGKTFAFLIPIFQHLINTRKDSSDMVKCVVIAPTRDLALQIETEVRKIHQNNNILKKFSSVSLVGGTNFGEAMRRMRQSRPNIVIGTPGRLIDVLEKHGSEYFSAVDFKVLDEADRLLEIGFKDDLSYINKMLNDLNSTGPKNIRTLLFSATLDHKVQSLSNDIMNKDKCLYIDTIDENEPEAHERIDQSIVVSDQFSSSIYAALEHIEKQSAEIKDYKGILFLPTVKFTKFFANVLKRNIKFPVYEFHGQVTQNKRTRIVTEFKKKSKGLLVCTDVGARGMDFPNITEVLQIGLPSELPNYIHRIGRTARSGKEGSSVAFISKSELPFFKLLEEEHKVKIENVTEYEPQPHIMEALATKLHVNEDELHEIILSILSFYQVCLKDYGMNYRKILPEVAETYGALLLKEDKRLPFQGYHLLNRYGLGSDPVATKIFQVDELRSRNSGRRPNHKSYSRRGQY
ncbi:Uncharacterized protein RNJ44_02691 [Nakaseomyces bracarensis]|uniref:ATP-dependent RNA helicase n=1 Tax=Nakaseomyces bracarensis TaxID=273131 RepID=A0ABR4P004_9SACH